MLTNDAYEAMNNLELVQGYATNGQINAIVAAADGGGTVQAEDMLRLFPGRPEWHTATKLWQALYWAGCKDA